MDPLVSLVFGAAGEVVHALGREEGEAVALVLGADRDADADAVAVHLVAEEDLALGVRVERVVVVHQLAVVEREPAPLVPVGGAGAGLRDPALAREVAAQHAHQVRLVGHREGDLQPVQLRAPDRHVPVVHHLGVVVVDVDVPRAAVLHERDLHRAAVLDLGRRERHVQLGDAQHRLRLLALLHVVLERVIRLREDELARLVAAVLLALLHQEPLHVARRVAGPVVQRELQPLVLGPDPLLDQYPAKTKQTK